MRYYIVSDVHSHFSFMKESLLEKGFLPHEDALVVAGDLFDRGKESLELLEYIENLPHKILIRGNHEFEFLNTVYNILHYGYPEDHQYHNGTVETLFHLSREIPEDVSVSKALINKYEEKYGDNKTRLLLKKVALNMNIMKFIKMIEEEFINYFELGDYIICHAWIPSDYSGPCSIYSLGSDYRYAPYWKNEEMKNLYKGKWLSEIPDEALVRKALSYDPDWKEASLGRWEEASWANPLYMGEMDILPSGKTIISGHIHTRLYWEGEEGKSSDDIYFGKNFIGLDARTYYSHKVNVLILDEDGKIEKEKE